MPIPLHQVLERIFRPSSNAVRQVVAVPRSVAEQIPLVDSVAVISVTAPEKLQASLAAFEHVLRLSFADVDFLSAEMTKRRQAKLKAAFTAQQAGTVLAFVEALPQNIRTIVVHCEGGYSRSCAIALALADIYGYEADRASLGEANPSVLRTLKDVAFMKLNAKKGRK
ncbi:dual specificity protein phosphatase family protein [Herbaspirillum camelliae]|uniref:dual specificity protein phosphatase family protein n=1 Tax=Herbaspirillum camelliae TaxID=1892903 RepID=UPI000949C6F0|nr:dual specificity protein phosphatase family protein [Herbaspirillum camelliae]